MSKVLSKTKAEAYLAAVKNKFRAWNLDNEWDFAQNGDKPTLVENWNNDGHWAIVWEGNAPYEWAVAPISDDYFDEEFHFTVKGVPVPPGVHAEPYYSFVLMLYPEG